MNSLQLRQLKQQKYKGKTRSNALAVIADIGPKCVSQRIMSVLLLTFSFCCFSCLSSCRPYYIRYTMFYTVKFFYMYICCFTVVGRGPSYASRLIVILYSNFQIIDRYCESVVIHGLVLDKTTSFAQLHSLTTKTPCLVKNLGHSISPLQAELQLILCSRLVTIATKGSSGVRLNDTVQCDNPENPRFGARIRDKK